MRTCCSRVGRKPAKVTRTVYRPGVTFSPWKTPCVLVRKSTAAKAPADSEINCTVAPICGTPKVSFTTPASLPELAAFTCAREGATQNDRHVPARNRAPRIWSRLSFTARYLPGAALPELAAVLVSAGALMENSAVLETLLLELESVARISSEYLPGVRVAKGKRRSMVTCSPVCFISSLVSLNCMICWSPFLTVYTNVALDLCVLSSGVRLYTC